MASNEIRALCDVMTVREAVPPLGPYWDIFTQNESVNKTGVVREIQQQE